MRDHNYMAFQSHLGTSSRRRKSHPPMSEINVTPFVDVMLVLLVVFMVTAPMLTVSVPVNLPQVKGSAMKETKEPLTITINRQGDLYIQERRIDGKQLIPQLQAITQSNPNAKIYVRGDRRISYGAIMQVMSQIQTAGFQRVGLIAGSPDTDKS